MSENKWNKVVLFFHAVCWIATATVISYWLYIFNLNEDLSIVDYKNYYQSKSDLSPVLSVCLQSPFSKQNLRMTSDGINETSYLEFLNGNYFVPEMLNVEYKNITLNMSKYVVEYFVKWRNGSSATYAHRGRETFTTSYAGFISYPHFHNCYAMQVPSDSQIEVFSVLVNSNIFPFGIRPVNFNMVTILHYPNQLLRSYKTRKHSWTKRGRNDSYAMRFIINGAEVISRRNKENHPCDKHWETHDDNVIVNHVNNVGCRSPYQNPSNNISLCLTKDQMKNARFTLRSGAYGFPLPCKAMEKIYYTYEESELSGTAWPRAGHFWIGIYLIDQQFKEIVQTR